MPAASHPAFLRAKEKSSIDFDYLFESQRGALSQAASGYDHCWLFTENELQVYRLSGSARGARIFKWLFETPAGTEMPIRLVDEITVAGLPFLLVSLESSEGGASASQLQVLDLTSGLRVGSTQLLVSGRPAVATAATQVPPAFVEDGVAASLLVGTHGGAIFQVDIEVDAHAQQGSQWRMAQTIVNGTSLQQRGVFQYREKVLPVQRVAVTALQYISQLSGFAAGFSFSGFELYTRQEAGRYRRFASGAQGAATGSGVALDAAAVTHFAYQQRFDGFLWVVRGPSHVLDGRLDVGTSLRPSTAHASLFRVANDAHAGECSFEEADVMYERQLSAEAPERTRSSRLVHCGPISSHVDEGHEGQSDFVLFVWEAVAMNRQSLAQTELHAEVFNLRAGSPLDSSLPPETLKCFTRFSIADPAAAAGNFDSGMPLLAALVVPASVADHSVAPKVAEEGEEDIEQHGSSGSSMDTSASDGHESLPLSFDVRFLFKEGSSVFRFAGPVPAALEELGAAVLSEDNMLEQFSRCVDAGLIQPVESWSVQEQWRSLFDVLLDNHMSPVICQYLVSHTHTLRPGLVYDWVTARAKVVIDKYEEARGVETRGQAAIDEDYTRLADCFSVLNALLSLQSTSSSITADVLRTLQYLELQSWLREAIESESERSELQQHCYTMSQVRKSRRKPKQLFVERLVQHLKASIASDEREGEAMEDEDDIFLDGRKSFNFVYPVDLQRLLQCAAPEVMMTKRCFVYYYLLDVAAISKKQEDAAQEFANAFMLPLAFQHAIKSLWIIDSADWENYGLAAQLLTEFWAAKRQHSDPLAQEILSWAGEILSAFLQDPEYRKVQLGEGEQEAGEEEMREDHGRLRAPLLFLYAASPQLELGDLEAAVLAILFGSNSPVQDAFAFQRRMLRRPLSKGQKQVAVALLAHIFEYCEKQQLVDLLFLHHFDELEETCLLEYFTARDRLDFMVVFYLQRCRHAEATALHKQLNDAGKHSNGRDLLLANASALNEPFESSAAFASLPSLVKDVRAGGACAGILVAGPASMAVTTQEEPARETPVTRVIPSTPVFAPVVRPSPRTTLVHGKAGQVVPGGTARRANRILQPTAHLTPLIGAGVPLSTKRGPRHELNSTPFAGSSVSRLAGTPRLSSSGTPAMSPYPGTPTYKRGPSTPLFPGLTPTRAHDTMDDIL